MSLSATVWGLVGLSGALSLWFLLRYSAEGPSLTKSVVKTASVAGLALAALLAGGSVWLVMALSLAALGDLCLSRDGDRAFLFGLVSFALAHLAYIVLMLASGVPLAFKLPAAAVVLFAFLMLTVLFPRAGALRWPVVGYVAIIGTMAAIAVSMPASFALAMLAALSFMLSDMILGLERFVWGAANPLRRAAPYAIWSSYWAAQLLFLVAFALVGGR